MYFQKDKGLWQAMGPWLPTMHNSEQRKLLVCSGLPVQNQDEIRPFSLHQSNFEEEIEKI